jgi:hypothetical protein
MQKLFNPSKSSIFEINSNSGSYFAEEDELWLDYGLSTFQPQQQQNK